MGKEVLMVAEITERLDFIIRNPEGNVWSTYEMCKFVLRQYYLSTEEYCKYIKYIVDKIDL